MESGFDTVAIERGRFCEGEAVIASERLGLVCGHLSLVLQVALLKGVHGEVNNNCVSSIQAMSPLSQPTQ